MVVLSKTTEEPAFILFLQQLESKCHHVHSHPKEATTGNLLCHESIKVYSMPARTQALFLTLLVQ